MSRQSRPTIAGRLRSRRDRGAFDRALRAASPAMQQELLAAAARSQFSTR